MRALHRLPRFGAATLFALLLILILGLRSHADAAAGVQVDASARVNGTYTGTAVSGISTPLVRFDFGRVLQLGPGTGVGNADKVFFGERTLGASGTENLDLAGSLADPFGATITCAKVKAMMFTASSGNTNNVNVGGAGSNTFVGPFADATDIVSIPPGGTFFVTAPVSGWTVTASTGDILKIANSGGTTGITYKVMIVCATA